MHWLHRISNHAYEFAIERLKVSLLAELCGEGIERLPRIVLAAVEAPVYEGLDAPPQGVEQGCDYKGRDYYGQLRQPLLACERLKDGLSAVTPPTYTSASVAVREP